MSAATSEPLEAKHPSDVIGTWGPAQRTIVIIIGITYMVAPFSNNVIVLYAPKQNFTCNYYDEATDSLTIAENACTIQASSGLTVKCSNFTYDTSFYQRTMVSQFDLVCDRAWYASFSQSLHQIGYAVSGVLVGFISDRYGRVFAGRLSILLEIAAGFGQAFAPNIWVFWFARFFIGVAAYGRFLTGFVMMTEWVGPKLRARVTILVGIGWYTAYLLMVIFFREVPDFRTVQVTASTTEIGIFVIYLVFVNETPRWLITHSKAAEAEDLLTKAAKAKDKLPEAEVKRRILSLQRNAEREIDENSKNQTIVDIWKEPVLLKLSLILYFTWFAHSFIAYASSFIVESLGGNMFDSMLILSASGSLEIGFSYLLIDRLSRKKTLIWGMLLESLSLLLLLVACLNEGWYVYRILASIVNGYCLGFVLYVYYVYTAESFPTAMRQAGMGACSIFARIGSVVAPFTKELTISTHLVVPFAIFLALTIINAMVITLVPDTGAIQVADTITQKKNEVQDLRENNKSAVHVT